MNIFNDAKILLFIVPIAIVMLVCWVFELLPRENQFVKFMNVIAEKDLEKLMKKNGFEKTTIITYQILRILLSLLFAAMYFTRNKIGTTTILITVLIIAVTYKFFYFWLVYRDKSRIRKLNQELPYMMKTLIYLTYSYGIVPAIKKALESVNTVFKYDLNQLLKDIDENPTSKTPYDNFVNRYEGKIKNLDVYMSYLFRIQNDSSTKEATDLMTSLNDTITHEMAVARKQKNDNINLTIGTLGYIPVILSVIIIVLIMIQSLNLI